MPAIRTAIRALPSDVLDRALQAKIEAAEQSGLRLHIVTQFSFDAAAIIRWVTRLREFGCEQPVRIGMAGPTNLTSLLRYAQRCGVKASAAGVTRNAGLVKHLFGVTAPDGIIRALTDAAASGTLGEVARAFLFVRRPRLDRALGDRRAARPHHARRRHRLHRQAVINTPLPARRGCPARSPVAAP